MQTLQRTCILAVALLMVGSLTAMAQLPSNQLEGTWQMVSQELVYPDSVIDRSDNWGPGFKILNSTHFAWGRETRNGDEVLAGGGRYQYMPEKDVYIEHIEYHSDSGMAGLSVEFEARVDGDTWYHIGDLGDYKLREVWKRVDPQTALQESRDQSASRGSASGTE